MAYENVALLKVRRARDHSDGPSRPTLELEIEDTHGPYQVIRLEYPFVRPHEVENDFLIIPAMGSFLRDYSKGSRLHAGICGPAGRLLEFDRSGVIHSSTADLDPKWNQSVPLRLTGALSGGNQAMVKLLNTCWATVFEETTGLATSTEWSSLRFDEHTNNCFNFVLAFLARLMEVWSSCGGAPERSICSADLAKETFCERFVAPRAKQAARYIAAYREFIQN